MTAPTLVQHKKGDTIVTLDTVPVDGRLLTVWLSNRGPGTTQSSPPSGFTYVDIATIHPASDHSGRLYWRIASNEAARSEGAGAYASTPAAGTMHITEWANGTFGAFVSASHQGDSTVVTAGGAITPSQNDTIVVGCVVASGFATVTMTPDAGVTELSESMFISGVSPFTWQGYKAVAAAVSTTIGGTIDSSQFFGGVTFTILGAADPPTPGMWYDFDRDGFDDAGSASDDHPLARALPEGGSTVTDLVTSDVISVQIDRVADTLGGTPIGSMTVVTKNTSGKYNPDNSGSTVFGKIDPGMPVWFGCNADLTLSGTGQTVYGRFGGYLRTVAPIPVGGATDAPTVQWVFDDAMARYRDAKARVVFAANRSVATYRTAILAAINETRLDLATEADTLPSSGAVGIGTRSSSGSAAAFRFIRFNLRQSLVDSLTAALGSIAKKPIVTALAVLEDLNRLVGTRHFIAPADTKESWYTYSTRNRQYKVGSAADGALTAMVSETSGYVHSNDGIVNAMSVEARPYREAGQASTVWQHSAVPFSITASTGRVIIADFGDMVLGATVTIRSTASAAVAVMTPYGDGAAIQVATGSADTVTALSVDGRPVIRLDSVVIEESDPSSIAAFGEMQGPNVSSELVTSEGLAEAIAKYHIWASARPRKSPSVTIYNHPSTLLPLDLFDVVTLSIDQLDVSLKRFEIVGIHETWTVAASASLALVAFTLDLRQTPNASALSLLTFGTSLYGGSDQFAP